MTFVVYGQYLWLCIYGFVYGCVYEHVFRDLGFWICIYGYVFMAMCMDVFGYVFLVMCYGWFFVDMNGYMFGFVWASGLNPSQGLV
jgi:hypothetical protein